MDDLCMTVKEPIKGETAKTILENMQAILVEMYHVAGVIEDGLYGYQPTEEGGCKEPQEPPMLDMLKLQQDYAERILKKMVHIREGLW